MKKFFLLCLLGLSYNFAQAQCTTHTQKECNKCGSSVHSHHHHAHTAPDTLVVKNQYTFLYNTAPANFHYPLVGIVNFGTQNYAGVQLGAFNTIWGSGTGSQTGITNTVKDDFKGTQVGLASSVGGRLEGLQLSGVNISIEDSRGVQTGLVNISASKLKGAQFGGINIADDDIQSFQMGLINHAGKRLKGTQVGLINSAKSIHGTQLGLINVVDTIQGVPVGFLSIVKHNAYKAIELSFNQMYPYNLALKLGVPQYYTYLKGSFNPEFHHEFAAGFGIGSLKPFTRNFFFNPEAEVLFPMQFDYFQSITSLTLNLRLRISQGIELSAGPSLAWSASSSSQDKQDPLQPSYSLKEYQLDTYNVLSIGMSGGISIRL